MPQTEPPVGLIAVAAALARDTGGFTCPAGSSDTAQRGPALDGASSLARFAVAGRACGLCGQLIRDCETTSSDRWAIITVS
jgi:hypothetical protein